MWVNKLIVVLAVAIFLIVSICNPASAREITVDDNGSDADFKSIQEAIDSRSGNVILVYPGCYNESVDIMIQNISILSVSENPEDTTVRAFNLHANNITVIGFSLQEDLTLRKIFPTGFSSNDPIENCTVKNSILELGINANNCYNTTIEKNIILNSGIIISGPDNVTASNFRISDNLIVKGNIDVYHGLNDSILFNNSILKGTMHLNQCYGYKILENYVSNDPAAGSGGIGIFLSDSFSNELENNMIVNCSEGIRINSGSNIVKNNILTYNVQGIIVGSEGGNSLLNNTISNSSIGIFLSCPAFIGNSTGEVSLLNGGDSILNNTISNNTIGIFFEGDPSGDSSSNIVANNKVELNKQYGIYIKQVGYNIPYNGTNWFYNNIFNNTVNYFNDVDNNKSNYYTAQTINNSTKITPLTWNITKTSGTNIVGGPYFGGNYWAKPDGTGFSQNCVDSDEDGIADLPYDIGENETDYLPLASISKSQTSIIPIANFSTDISHNLVPVAIQFTDLSKNSILWSWDFDNDGLSDSTSQNPVYSYTVPGTYIVNLTVSNGRDESSKSMKIILQEATVPPVAEFKTNVISGQVPLSVQFTDYSKNATSWVWDFNNDGITDSIEKNPVYVYTYPGNYTVNLTVDNIIGSASKLSTVTVSPAQRVDGELILTEYQIAANISNWGNPAIFGDRIVWSEKNNESWDICMYNLSTYEETQITTSKSNKYNIGIYGDNIIWNDWHEGSENRDIYVYNISTSTETRIINNKSDKWLPAIYGDKIVWIDYRSGNSNVYMYNLSTSKETQITSSKSDGKYDPDIYDDRVVWVDGDIYMYDLSTSRETQITSIESGEQQPVVYGDIIVWQDNTNWNSDIYMYDLSTSKETRITTSGSAGDHEIHGDRVVWKDYRNGNSDIYMYDISTKKETQISTSGLAVGSPAIYGDRIVWMDLRNESEVNGLPQTNEDIYMCTVSVINPSQKTPVADFFANVTAGNAPLRVLFTDNSTGAPNFWHWDFGDGINSKHALNATHTFTEPGTYDVSLTVTNENGSNTRIIPGYITVSSDS